MFKEQGKKKYLKEKDRKVVVMLKKESIFAPAKGKTSATEHEWDALKVPKKYWLR